MALAYRCSACSRIWSLLGCNNIEGTLSIYSTLHLLSEIQTAFKAMLSLQFFSINTISFY